MTDIYDLWEAWCQTICENRCMNRAELDRGFQTGRWHIQISLAVTNNFIPYPAEITLEDGPSLTLQ